ncbi:MAG: hypothetical protein AABX96_01705 [Nanoarchaeota archaeon]
MEKENNNQAENEDVSEYFKEQSIKASKKGLHYDKKEFYEQYEKRLKRAGL